MIEELDESLRQLLIQKGNLDAGEVDIAFEAPTREWAATLSKPTINLYLYDIRENTRLREADYWATERRRDGQGVKRRLPVRVDLLYMITAWTAAIEDEHRLLSRAILTLFRHPILPRDVLQGSLAQQDRDIPSQVAQPDGNLKGVSDFWTALGNSLKAGIAYQVTLSMDPEVALTTRLVFTRKLRFQPPAAGPAEELLEVAGYVRPRGQEQGVVPGATVTVVEEGLSTVSDAEGRFRVPRLPPGEYTFRVLTPGNEEREMTVTVPGTSYDLEL